MPHFFGTRRGDRVDIEGADARHLAGPLRTRPGQEIAVVEPEGRLLRVRVERVSRELVSGLIVEEHEHRPEPAARVTIAVAMLPAPALELVLSRCTEAGAAGFLLVQADRSVGRGARPERWAAICREAAMLAGRLRVPEVAGPVPLPAALAMAENPVLLDRGAERRLADVGGGAITVFIGPEGGWSPAELGLAEGRVAQLGPRNLRADTAALSALVVALSVRGDI